MSDTYKDALTNLCLENSLSYDGEPPTMVSPGILMFQAVELNAKCKTLGQCRQRPHYAMILGDKLKLC